MDGENELRTYGRDGSWPNEPLRIQTMLPSRVVFVSFWLLLAW